MARLYNTMISNILFLTINTQGSVFFKRCPDTFMLSYLCAPIYLHLYAGPVKPRLRVEAEATSIHWCV